MDYGILNSDGSVTVIDEHDGDAVVKAIAQYRDPNRRIALTDVGDFEISTVFLVINHGFDRIEQPQWFETMVFPKSPDVEWDGLDVRRYATIEEARKGHQETVEYWAKQSELYAIVSGEDAESGGGASPVRE